MRTPLAPTMPARPVVPAPALAVSVAAHLLVGALALLVVVHPTPPPAEPVPLRMVFAALSEAAPPALPPPAEVPDIPVPEPLPLQPPVSNPPLPEAAPRRQSPPEAAPAPPAHRVTPRQPPRAATGQRAAVVAPAASVAPIAPIAPTPTPAPPPAQAQGEALAAWRGALAAWLHAHRRYPEQARHDGVQGQPTVRFTIEPSGRVTSVELVTSSGSTVLDEATLAMLRGATLPPFPPGLSQTSRTETVRVHYALD